MIANARLCLLGFLSLFIGCGSVATNPIDGGATDAPLNGPDADCSAGCPVGRVDLDGNPSTGACGCEYACQFVSIDDPIDPGFTDENCDGSDGVVASCVFVSATLGSPAGLGTRADPVNEVALGITTAANSGKDAVCVSGEIYAENVDMISSISVYGGFDHTDAAFAFRRSANVTTVVRAVGTVFLAPQIDVETHIEGLEIDALWSNAVPGRSTYGVRLTGGGGVLYVRYNAINSQPGTAGENGQAGTAQTPQGPSLSGQNGTANSNAGGAGATRPFCLSRGGAGGDGGYNSDGVTGGDGAGPTSGGVGGAPACGNGGNNGDPGRAGGPGVAGASGPGGASSGIVQNGSYLPAGGQNGAFGSGADAGGGGGGGGGGQNNDLTNCPVADTGGGGGAGGCGGLGGRFGAGAGGGGGSFGVFAAAQIVVTDNAISTANGGDGGIGGNSGVGQLGGTGGSGGLGGDDGGDGGDGGVGGNGGTGGPGGGGGGGPSACVAHLASVTPSASGNMCTLGAPGTGGPGGTGPGTQAGSAGIAANNLPLN